jgi:luciferase family oxidoreductase group 1
MTLRLSVLDQSPVGESLTREEALRSTVRFATVLDGLGYTRFWLAEHHNSPGSVGTSPEILVTAILERTERMRVGTGGILLPLYRVEKVAEVFRALAALYPGFVDLGVGRAGGPSAGYPSQLVALQSLLAPADQDGPAAGPSPWLLGTSRSSSELAASLGMGYAFGYFLNPSRAADTLTCYRNAFTSASASTEPNTALAVRVVVAETAVEALDLTDSVLLWRVRKDLGHDLPFPTVKATRDHEWTDAELMRRRVRIKDLVHGAPDSVRRSLDDLATHHHVEELIVNTPLPCFDDRLLSYQLLADSFDLHAESTSQSETPLHVSQQTGKSLPRVSSRAGELGSAGYSQWHYRII